jgi:hypothetical protein
MSNRAPTLTCGSSQSNQACCVTLFHTSIGIWRVSLVACTSSMTFSSLLKISSTVFADKVVSFSFVSCVSCFVVPCMVANSPITQSASSCKDSIFCSILFYSSFICYTSAYNCFLAKIVVICLICLVGLLLCAPYFILNLLQLWVHYELGPNMDALVAHPCAFLF